MRAGDPAHSMYFIAAGEVEVALKKERLRLGVGQFFGEVAVLRRARRSATATALTRTNLLVLAAQDLHALMQRDSRIAERINDVVEKRVGRERVSPQGRYRDRGDRSKPARRSSGARRSLHGRCHKNGAGFRLRQVLSKRRDGGFQAVAFVMAFIASELVRRRRTQRQSAAIAAFSVALGRIAADALADRAGSNRRCRPACLARRSVRH